MIKPYLPLAFVFCCAPAWAQNLVSVRVLDEAGKPIAGAIVAARVYTRDETELAPVSTDGTGEATFSLPNNDEGKTAPAAFTAGAKGYSFASETGIEGKPVEIRLERGKPWRGKVVDEQGQPLAGARIFSRGAMKGRDYENMIFLDEKGPVSALYSAQSKADGSFEIADLPADKDLLYGVTRPMFARVVGQSASVDIVELIKMKAGGLLTGRALDVAGQPLANFEVYASIVRSGGGGGAKTDAQGNFTIDGLAPGSYELSARQPAAAGFVMPRLASVRVEAGQTATAPV